MDQRRNAGDGHLILRRRELLALIGSMVVGPIPGHAQQTGHPHLLGVLTGQSEDDPATRNGLQQLRRALQAHGWREGDNLQIVYRFAAGDLERIRSSAAELIGLAPDLIVAHTTPVAAVLRQATRALPIVFVSITDPVADGFVASLARPGGNMTGFTNYDFAKAVSQDKLDQPLTQEDKELLLAALRQWGALDSDYAYKAGILSSDRRGYAGDPGGGLSGAPVSSEPLPFAEILRSRVWFRLALGQVYEFQSTIFQPVGGMDAIAGAFVREVGSLIRYNAKVTAIKQDEHHVRVTYVDATTGSTPMTAAADWCLCTIPLSVLNQIDLNVGAPMMNAINAVPYGAAAKIGMQFKRRFWEEDEQIYGGISYTDLPIWQIGYPNTSYGSSGKGVLLGAYVFDSPYAYEFTALPPEDRLKKAIEYGAQIHPQYETDYENGIAVGWHRVPWVLGCFGRWTEEARKQHYQNLCAIDGRIVLAGEHASHIPAWQEGAVLSSLDAISRLHQRVVAG